MPESKQSFFAEAIPNMHLIIYNDDDDDDDDEKEEGQYNPN